MKIWRRITVGVSAAACSLSLAAPVSADSASVAVTPAVGSYNWSTTYEDSGGAKEIVSLKVTNKSTVAFDTVRGICRGDFGVLHTFTGRSRLARVQDGQVTKSRAVTLDGDTATVTVNVRWSSPTRARGWIRVTGRWADRQCTGVKRPFVLSYFSDDS